MCTYTIRLSNVYAPKHLSNKLLFNNILYEVDRYTLFFHRVGNLKMLQITWKRIKYEFVLKYDERKTFTLWKCIRSGIDKMTWHISNRCAYSYSDDNNRIEGDVNGHVGRGRPMTECTTRIKRKIQRHERIK